MTIEISPGSNTKSIKNEPVVGSAKFTKIGESLNSLDNSLYKLPGSTFRLYYNSNYDGDYNDNYDYKKGDVVRNIDGDVIEVTSDKNGIVNVDNLKYGKYYFKEVSPTTGYQLNTDTYSFSITEHGLKVDLGNVENKKIIGNEEFLKVAENSVNGDYELYPKSGVTFTVYQKVTPNLGSLVVNKPIDKYTGIADEFIYVDGITYQAINDVNSNNSGMHYYNNLDYGEYLIVETKKDVCYIEDDTKYNFNIPNNDPLVTIDNYYNRGQVVINKSVESPITGDNNYYPYEGLEFNVYKDNNLGSLFFNGAPIFDGYSEYPLVTDISGIATSPDVLGLNGPTSYSQVADTNSLKCGSYYVKEIDNPYDSVYSSNDVYNFSITQHDDLEVIDIKNERNKGSVQLHKQADTFTNDTNHVDYNNAEFVLLQLIDQEIYDILTQDNNEYEIYNTNGNLVSEYNIGDYIYIGNLINDNDGVYTYDDLKMGDYLVVEKTNDEYLIDPDFSYTFSVNYNGEDVVIDGDSNLNGNNPLINEIKKGSIKLHKQGNDFSVLNDNVIDLEGAEFSLYNNTMN